MKNENIIIALIFLVIVALFAFNFSKMTGFAPKKIITPTVTISPPIIKPNGILNITIKINDACVDPSIKIYQIRGKVEDYKQTKDFSSDIECARISSRGAKIPCGSINYCKGKLKDDTIKTTFDTYDFVPGQYVLRVYYYDKEKKSIDTKFRIS